MQPYMAAQPAPITSGLRVTPKFIFLQFMLFLVKPVVTIGHQKHSINWNQSTVLPLQPGQYEIKVHFPWIGDGNPAKLMVAVHPGHITELSYATKLFVFSPGDLRCPGFQPWGT